MDISENRSAFKDFMTKFNKLFIVLGFLAAIVCGLIFLSHYSGKHSLLSMSFACVFAALILLIVFLIINGKKKFLKLENLYFICAMVLGSIYLFVIPPDATPDEVAHITSSYHLSNIMMFQTAPTESTMLFSDTSVAPVNINVRESDLTRPQLAELNEGNYITFIKGFADPVDEDLIPAERNVITPSIVYIVSATGITLGRLLHLNYAWCLFLGGFFNMLLFIFSVYFCLKILPVGKLTMAVIALLPMTLQQTSSISYDNLIITTSLLITAVSLSYLYKNTMSLKHFIIYAIASAFIVLSKSGAYVFIVFLPFLFGLKKGNFKKKNIIIFCVVTLCVVLLMGRGVVLKNTDPAYLNQYVYNDEGGVYINWAQDYGYGIKELLNDPLLLLKIIKNTIVIQGNFLIESAIAGPLSWLQITLPCIVSYTSLLILFISALKNESAPEPEIIGKREKVCMLFVYLAVIGSCAAAMLLYWTPKGYEAIQGLQGRYFIPVLFLIIINVRNNSIVVKKNIDNAIMLAIAVMHFVVMYRLFDLVR